MIYEVYYQYSDNEGKVFTDKITVSASSKEEALHKYNLFAVRNNMTGIDNLDNVKEFKVDIE